MNGQQMIANRRPEKFATRPFASAAAVVAKDLVETRQSCQSVSLTVEPVRFSPSVEGAVLHITSTHPECLGATGENQSLAVKDGDGRWRQAFLNYPQTTVVNNIVSSGVATFSLQSVLGCLSTFAWSGKRYIERREVSGVGGCGNGPFPPTIHAIEAAINARASGTSPKPEGEATSATLTALSGASIEASAIATVRAIYQAGLRGLMGPNPALMRPYFTPALIAAWTAPQSLADGPTFEGDPLSWTQMTDKVTLVSATGHDFAGDHGVVEATVGAVVEDVPRIVTITWSMRRVGGRWLADDNSYGGKSLRAELMPVRAAAPAKRVSAINRSFEVPELYGPDDYVADHNGSEVMISPATGTIRYFRLKSSLVGTVPLGATLFRGNLAKGTINGTAYVFRRGCPPAPYAVISIGHTGSGSAFTLTGRPPIRAPGSCAVIGYAEQSANAVLHFEPNVEGDI